VLFETFELLDTDKDIIFAATLEEIATCLKTGEEAPTLRRSIKRTPAIARGRFIKQQPEIINGQKQQNSKF
jgi:hypothetical protein